MFAALVVLACMDYVTGWAAAWVHGRARRGFFAHFLLEGDDDGRTEFG